jgi:hypothetical protein
MTVRRLVLFVLALSLSLASPAARAFQAGSLLFLDPNVGVRQWTPGGPTAPIVISGAPLSDPRGIAVDRAGNVLVADRSAGTLRYTPTGALQSNMGVPSIDVAIGGYSGGVYVLTENGDVVLLSPPYTSFLVRSIPQPRGIVSTGDGYTGDQLVVSSGANGGELLRVSLADGSVTPIATNLDAAISKPGADRFGNVLVPRPLSGHVDVLDPVTGAHRGSFASSELIDPQDVTSTSGDRYFVADGDNGGFCRIVEIDPIIGKATLELTYPACTNTPWSITAVPGGTTSPKLATNDVVLYDTGAFGGAGGIFRMNNAGSGVRALRLGGTPVAHDMLRVGPTRELVTAGPSVEAVHRIDPGTGHATLLLDSSQIGGTVMSAEYEKNGDLFVAVADPNPNVAGRLLTYQRASENVVPTEYFDSYWYQNACCNQPGQLLYWYRTPVDPFFGETATMVLRTQQGLPIAVAFSFDYGVFPNPGVLVPSVNTDFGAVDLNNYYYTDLYFTGFQAVGRNGSILSSGGLLTNITGLAVDESGYLLVADTNAPTVGGGGVIRINSTGLQAWVNKVPFVHPDAIAVVPPPACSDGIDNDGDGLVDYPADPGCLSPDDPWETVDCNDGIDNDGDGSIDYDPEGDGDPSCGSAQFGAEQTQCSDGADNDGDGKIDMADPQCTSFAGNNESKPACGLLGIEVVGVAGWAIGRKARRAVARR